MNMPSTLNRVAVVGSLNFDLVVRTPRFPVPGETLLGGPLTRSPGGKGVNQAVAAARAGALVAFAGCVGDDDFGRMFAETLAAESIECLLHVDPAAATGVGVIAIDTDGQNQIIVAPGANESFTAEVPKPSPAKSGSPMSSSSSRRFPRRRISPRPASPGSAADR